MCELDQETKEYLKTLGVTDDAMKSVHITKSMTPDDIDKAFDNLDPNSWEANCSECGAYYTGVFPANGDPETICPECGSNRCSLGSPAGGMNLLYRMDF